MALKVSKLVLFFPCNGITLFLEEALSGCRLTCSVNEAIDLIHRPHGPPPAEGGLCSEIDL